MHRLQANRRSDLTFGPSDLIDEKWLTKSSSDIEVYWGICYLVMIRWGRNLVYCQFRLVIICSSCYLKTQLCSRVIFNIPCLCEPASTWTQQLHALLWCDDDLSVSHSLCSRPESGCRWTLWGSRAQRKKFRLWPKLSSSPGRNCWVSVCVCVCVCVCVLFYCCVDPLEG